MWINKTSNHFCGLANSFWWSLQTHSFSFDSLFIAWMWNVWHWLLLQFEFEIETNNLFLYLTFLMTSCWKHHCLMTTNKNTTRTNQQIYQRGVQPSRIYNSIPQTNMCGETKQRENVSNQVIANRLNPTMVEQFRRNPYTQSLSSYAFP